jgi:two-component system response regulator (stage 0 sporulation protein F)
MTSQQNQASKPRPYLADSVLIADDEEEIRNSLAEILANDFSHYLTAGTGDEAMEILKNQDIDVLITDLKMPGLSGLDLLQKIVTEGWCTSTMIITGWGERTTVIRALQLGAYDFIDKPFTVDLVRNRAANALCDAKTRRLEIEALELMVEHFGQISKADFHHFSRQQRLDCLQNMYKIFNMQIFRKAN